MNTKTQTLKVTTAGGGGPGLDTGPIEIEAYGTSDGGVFVRRDIGGDFAADGFAPGDTITVSGFVNPGNNATFVIASFLAPSVLQVTDSTGLVTEDTGGVHIVRAAILAMGTDSAPVPGGYGRVAGIEVKYNGMPVTTVVEVNNVDSRGLVKNLLTLPAGNVDVPLVSVTEPLVDVSGTALTEDDMPSVQFPMVEGNIVVNVTGADALEDAVQVNVVVEI